jgi:hypothetical protein
MNNLKGAIPQSMVKGSGFVNTDLDFTDKGGELFFANPKCFVVGLNDLPHLLFVTPEFDERDLPTALSEKIYDVKKIILKTTFSDEIIRKQYYNIPNWLIKFNKVECIDFEDANLDKLAILNECPIEHFTFNNVKFDDKEKISSAILQFNNLKSISCDLLLFVHLKDLFQELNINVTILEEK